MIRNQVKKVNKGGLQEPRNFEIRKQVTRNKKQEVKKVQKQQIRNNKKRSLVKIRNHVSIKVRKHFNPKVRKKQRHLKNHMKTKKRR